MEIRPTLSALRRNKAGAFLIAAQIAVSLALLSNALHIVVGRLAVAARPSGLADESSTFLLTIQTLQQSNRITERAAKDRATTALRAVPGVASVALTSQGPMLGWAIFPVFTLVVTKASLRWTLPCICHLIH